jgi:hypothetical protein
VQVQVMPFADAADYRFNPFDLTKVWPHADYPPIVLALGRDHQPILGPRLPASPGLAARPFGAARYGWRSPGGKVLVAYPPHLLEYLTCVFRDLPR